MKSYVQGQYKPINPEKYVGTYPIVFRSSWEHKVMVLFDTNPNAADVVGKVGQSVEGVGF